MKKELEDISEDGGDGNCSGSAGGIMGAVQPQEEEKQPVMVQRKGVPNERG